MKKFEDPIENGVADLSRGFKEGFGEDGMSRLKRQLRVAGLFVFVVAGTAALVISLA